VFWVHQLLEGHDPFRGFGGTRSLGSLPRLRNTALVRSGFRGRHVLPCNCSRPTSSGVSCVNLTGGLVPPLTTGVDIMIRHGKAPYLECSSRGDKRFSALYAILPDGKSIEEHYQSSKMFENPDGTREWGLGIKEAKGRRAINMDYCRREYSRLWDTYIELNPHLLEVLAVQTGLSDAFGRLGCQCQATELWRIRRKYKERLAKRRQVTNFL